MISLLATLAAAAYSPMSECGTAPRIPEPRPGLRIVFEGSDGNQSGARILSTRNGETSYVYHLVDEKGSELKDGSFTVSTRRGVFPGACCNEDKLRISTYPRDPIEALAGLTVGDTVEIPHIEKSRIEGVEKTTAFPVQVTFLGCFTEEIAGRPEKVLRYRQVMKARTKAPRRPERVQTTETIVDVSARLGWWVSKTSDNRTISAVRIFE